MKVKCSGREAFVILGWTPPGGSRVGLGALHVGYYDLEGRLQYAGGVGSGFNDKELSAIRRRLDSMTALPPENLLVSGDPVDSSVTWVRPEIVVEVQFTDWSGAGRVRHSVYLGTREDKSASQVVRDLADPRSPRVMFKPRRSPGPSVTTRKGWHGAVPPRRRPDEVQGPIPAKVSSGSVIVARAQGGYH